MTAGLRGDIGTLTRFSASLRRLPTVVAQKVAEAAAPAITDLAKKTFAAGEDAYGNTWAPKADGTPATLRDTDKLFDGTKYVAIGTKLRVKLVDPDYRYVIGRRPIFPTQGGALPVEYVRTLARISVEVCRAELGL